MGHLTANNVSFPQQRTTRVGVVTTDGPPFKTMGYEIILIAHFYYVLAM